MSQPIHCNNRPITSYRELIVWQRSMELCEAVYASTRSFPEEEKYGIVAQMRRAAVSIPSNIAEGQGRLVGKDFRRFLGIARGSLRELETQTLLAGRIGYCSSEAEEQLLSLMEEVSRMLNTLITKLS